MTKKKLDTGTSLFDSKEAPSQIVSYAGDRPNPELRKFVEQHSTPYKSQADKYNVRAFRKPITSTKATAIYNMHSYHQGKKPHDAIRQYIRHYTQHADLVMDPFSGSGGTLLAALMEGRQAIAIDRSPAATFITKNYCTAANVPQLARAFEELKAVLAKELAWLYETRCDRCDGKATIAFTVYSYVFQCPRCLVKVPLFDCVDVESVGANGKPKMTSACPHCYKKGQSEEISTRSERFDPIPVLVNYICKNGCKPARSERRHNDSDSKKRRFFAKVDLKHIEEIESRPIPYWFPPNRMMNVQDDTAPWGVKWRAGTSNFRTVADLFTKRNLWALSIIREFANKIKDSAVRHFALAALTGTMFHLSRMSHHKEGGGGIMTGTYYIPQLFKERNAFANYADKLKEIIDAQQGGIHAVTGSICVSTQTVCDLSAISSNSIDYIFTDPPYSHTVQYGELNFVWEAWLGFDTSWHDEEIIVNDVRDRTEADWAVLMKKAMSECFRVLKPGRWLSLCYHDTSEGTWELVQDVMAEAGFLVDKTDSALFIDTGQKSYNQYTADKTTKRDLVLNFRKPTPLPITVMKGRGSEDAKTLLESGDIATFTDFARQIVRDFLTRHPGSTKDRVYDEVVSRLVASRSMEAHDFDALLRSVADEVQQPVKEDLFRNKEPDLWGSHVQSRWYLKETADQVDHAEQAKEDAAAARLSKFISEYLKKEPELEGVHYSDLFEQYLPIHDKPRRLLADWLVEYFIKTASGTWRLPDDEEGHQLAELREAGTLRRIKRFANALIEGVPVRDKDRPGGDVDLLDWLRQCRRAGLYEQGKAIYEKGGMNSANLTDEQQIEAEDDYRICARRGSSEEAKPKRQRRKKQDDDE